MSGRDGDALRRSLAAHLEALESWGVRRVVAPLPEASAAAPEPAAQSEPMSESRSTATQPAAAAASPAPSYAPAAPAPEAAAVLAAASEVVAGCHKCGLAASRNRTVFGVGHPGARLMFVGEAPGRDEDRKGEPFVGRAGQLLDRIIAAMGMRREDVYIANILKCRPPSNRDPAPDEVAACTPYLVEQIRTIQPQMLVALGRPAANFLLDSTESLGRLRGRAHEYQGIPVTVTYHPAYLLRNPAAKKDTWEDMKRVLEALGLPVPDPSGRS